MQSTASINLIKPKISLIDEITKWAFNIGRLLIIIVEIVAFSAFIYRFSLDRRLVDIHDSIEQKQNTIAHLQKQEDEFRVLQEKINISSIASTDGTRYLNILNQIALFAPPGMKFDTFRIGENKIEISITTNSMSYFSNFIKQLQEYDEIETVEITNIDSSGQKVNIVLKIYLKPESSKR